MAAWVNDSERQLEKDKDVFCHPCSSFFSNGAILMVWKNMMEGASIDDRNTTSLRFADDTDAIPDEEQELKVQVKSFDKT